jgi:heterodisulfide reductase subunit A-like polyferredoxin
MCPSTLVIGGGVTGLTAALELADAGQQVFLVEKQDHLGGNVARLGLTAPLLDSARDMLRNWISRAEQHPNIRLFLNSELTELKGFNGNFKPRVKTEDGELLELDAGSVLVCTGSLLSKLAEDRALRH